MSRPPSPRHRATAVDARVERGATLAGWTWNLGAPGPESPRARRLAHVGGLVSIGSLLVYLVWRVGFTLPQGGANLVAAWILVAFEALPVVGLTIRLVTLWNIDSRTPPAPDEAAAPLTVAVLIPTYNEPAEVLAPTVAAACELEPAHETWVLDDGDRDWVQELCAQYGARYVRREVHDHAKAGNMNHALELMRREAGPGRTGFDVLAVLDCDHVPLGTFLTSTLGWFVDPEVALVQAPQSYYNAGAFDDDGVTGEQGMFFHVLLAGRNHDGAGPFWCGSTSLIRTSALIDVGGISTATIVEDMHTTLELIRRGWKTVYHHQTLALGLAPATAEQYLLQRRRWGMGSMQVLARERLWTAKSWLSWRNYYEYLSGTLWWLEGVATLLVFVVPAAVMLSGARTSTASPEVFGTVFLVMFSLRLWGTRRLFRRHIHWRTAFALRIFRVPIGIACLWWLLTRRSLEFDVTPKGGAAERLRGRAPRIVWSLIVLVTGLLGYAALGALGLVPWRTTPGATVASGVWLALADVVLVLGARRILRADFASSRRNAHRVAINATVRIDGVVGTLIDVSVGGVAARFARGTAPTAGVVEMRFPGASPFAMSMVRVTQLPDGDDLVSLRVLADDWSAFREMSLWLFHTPAGVVDRVPAGVPAVAATHWKRTPRLLRELERAANPVA